METRDGQRLEVIGWLIVRHDGTHCDGLEMGSRASAEEVAARYANNSRTLTQERANVRVEPYKVEPVYRIVPSVDRLNRVEG